VRYLTVKKLGNHYLNHQIQGNTRIEIKSLLKTASGIESNRIAIGLSCCGPQHRKTKLLTVNISNLKIFLAVTRDKILVHG
jgi:hypothetical protein